MVPTRALFAVQDDGCKAAQNVLWAIQDGDICDPQLWVKVLRYTEAVAEVARRGMHHAANHPERLASIAQLARGNAISEPEAR